MNHNITPRPVSEAAEIARRVIAHTNAPNVSFSMHASVIAGLLVGIDELGAARARVAELEESFERMVSDAAEAGTRDADEIKRLRARVLELEADHEHGAGTVAHLNDEIERITQLGRGHIHRAARLENERDELRSTLQIIDAELNCQADGRDASATVEAIRKLMTQREPLTNEQIAGLVGDIWGHEDIAPHSAPFFARAVERAHGIEKPRSVIDLQGALARPGQPVVPIEAMRIGKCACGPDGCADSTCPGKCGVTP